MFNYTNGRDAARRELNQADVNVQTLGELETALAGLHIDSMGDVELRQLLKLLFIHLGIILSANHYVVTENSATLEAMDGTARLAALSGKSIADFDLEDIKVWIAQVSNDTDIALATGWTMT